MKVKHLYFIISSLFFLLGILLNHTYRSYIYGNAIYDFHLADTIGNWVAVPSATFLYLALSKRKKPISRIVALFVFTFIVYELLGIFKLHGVFDIYDVLATILSGCATCFILSKMRIKM